jgi:hypothetical protein
MIMFGTKTLFSSMTIWGVVVSVLGKLVTMIWGVEVDTSLQSTIAERMAAFAPLLISFVGDAMALIGRIRATKQIGTKSLP